MKDESLPTGDELEFEPSMDDLFKIAVDQEKITEIKRDSQMPPGTYLRDTNVPAVITRNVHPVTGRQGLSVFAVFENGKDKGGIRFRLSWVRANAMKRDPDTDELIDTGKPDWQNRLYVQMVETYKRAHDNEAPANVGELAQFIQNAPYRARIGNGTDSEIVYGIFPPQK